MTFRTCTMCGGSGYHLVDDDTDIPMVTNCPACDGQGLIEERIPQMEPCAECGGSGKTMSGAAYDSGMWLVDCPMCDGRGSFEVDPD